MNHTPDVAWADVVDVLDRSASVYHPVNAEIVRWLAPGAGDDAADLGCGAGGMTVLLAEAVGPGGSVLAVDGEPALLAATAARCDRAGMADRVRTLQHDLAGGPPPIDGLDLIWAAGVIHHLPDEQAAVRSLTSTLAPGGRLVLGEGGLSRRCLPWDVGVGEPGLEDRLGSAEADWFAAMRHDIENSQRTPYGWPTTLIEAGLVDVTAKSFLLDLPAPLDEQVRTHILGSLAAGVERTRDRLSPADQTAWARLLDPDGDDHLGRRDDLYLLAATTVHAGTRPPR